MVVRGKRKLEDLLSLLDVRRTCPKRSEPDTSESEEQDDFTKAESFVACDVQGMQQNDGALAPTGDDLQCGVGALAQPWHRNRDPPRSSFAAQRGRKSLRNVGFKGSEQVVEIENHRQQDLWYSCPGLWLSCDRCCKLYPQPGGQLRGGSGSQFSHYEFVCIPCLLESGDLIQGPQGLEAADSSASTTPSDDDADASMPVRDDLQDDGSDNLDFAMALAGDDF
mmetsp:Transcript_10506/g.23913  ORF Transcript_10506/g.23913 Transcript_10506/m.23913 type:complete len:223 (+) Transcript_10506:61-729(+)